MNQNQTTNDSTFKALITREGEDGTYVSTVEQRTIGSLPEGEVLIKVKFTGLNYKDALSASGNKGITRKFPHTPGVDAGGIVVESADAGFKSGDEVIVTGYDLGMNTSGGFAEYIRVPARWVVKRPQGISLKESMIIGTSGFTAASAIFEFIHHGIEPESGKILITGASGAVGSMAVAMLAANNYQVVASTGKQQAAELLLSLGATEIVDREAVDDTTGKPLLPGRWVAALDTVGGNTLSTAIRGTAERGIVTNCGMIASNKLDVSVFPFILRAVRLVGIASAETPMKRRLEIWDLISRKLLFPKLNDLARTVTLEQVPAELEQMLKGEQMGKVIVEMGD